MVSLTNRALVSFIVEDNYSGLHHLLESRRVAVDDRDEVRVINVAINSLILRCYHKHFFLRVRMGRQLLWLQQQRGS